MSALVIPHNRRLRAVPYSTREAAQQADESMGEWNARYPAGTPVKAYRLYGDETTAWHTQTTSEARVIGGVSVVVWVEGCDYALYLSHVVPLVGASDFRLAGKVITIEPGKGVDCG